MSIAYDGRLRELSGPDELRRTIREFLGRTSPGKRGPPTRWRHLAARWPEAALALGVACGLWFLLGPGSAVVELQRSAPVVVENLPDGYVLRGVEPSEVRVTLSGRRRDLYLSDAAELRLPIDALLVQLGRRTFEVAPNQVDHPRGLRVLDVEPGRVRLSVERSNGAGRDATEELSEPAP